VFNNLEIIAFKVFTIKCRGKGDVTNRQSVDSNKIRLPLEPLEPSVRYVGLEWDWSGIAQNPSKG